ncbi:hypothetical protein GPALN_005314 [Globodera pallida]|nr:hypothetical protein GPALN_005314 [Globodera pallida]
MSQQPNTSFKIVDTDDKHQLKILKEGEIVKGKNGKLYRARKTIYPSQTGGPRGVGDPESRLLNQMEEKLLIPEMMDKEVHKTECRSEFSAVVQCLRVEGSLLGPHKCKPYLKVYEDCKLMKFQDDDFRKKVTEDYIEERSKFREMGLNKKQRKFYEYLQWKEKQNVGGTYSADSVN